jgi:trigger factor
MEGTPMAEEQTAVEERPALTVSVEDSGPARKELTIEIPESRIKEKIESSFGELSNDAQLPGFRKGRAPQRLLEKRFGKSVRDDARGQLLSECYSQAIEDEKIEVLGDPDIKDMDDIDLPESGSLTFKVEVEVAPEVKLPALDGLEVTKTIKQVANADVDEELERFGQQFGKLATVTDSKVAEEDFVGVDARVLAGEDAGDDAELIEHRPEAFIMVNGKSADYKGHVLGILVGDMGKQLKGKSVGDEVRISMAGPPNHENDKIKDQPITLVLRLDVIQRQESAPIEKIVEQFGVESEADLRSRLREMLEQRNERQQVSDLHAQVLEKLGEQIDFELPEGLTGRQTARVLARQRMELSYRGLPEEKIEKELAETRAGSEEETRKQLKQFFIVEQAGKDLNVEVTEAEVNGRLSMMAMQQGRRLEKLRQEMRKRGELSQVYLQIREQKTLDAILEKVKVTEVAGESTPDSAAASEKKSTKKSTKKSVKKSAKKSDDD